MRIVELAGDQHGQLAFDEFRDASRAIGDFMHDYKKIDRINRIYRIKA